MLDRFNPDKQGSFVLKQRSGNFLLGNKFLMYTKGEGMKKNIIVALALSVLPALLMAQNAGIKAAYPHFELNASTTGAALVQGRADTATFGITADTKTPVLQIMDAAGKVLKSVSADEFSGKEDAAWKPVADDTKSGDSSAVSAYSVTAGKQSFEVLREVRLMSDEHMPGGKQLSVSFSLKSAKAMKVKVKFSGKADGTASSSADAFFVESKSMVDGAAPAVICRVSPKSQLSVSAAQKNTPQTVSASTAAVEVPAGTPTTVFGMAVLGTTVRGKDHLKKQAENIKTYVDKKKSAPDFAATTVSSKKAAASGDTITYTLYYHNIGTSAGVDIEVNNPIAAGVTYIDNSAAGDGTDISFDKAAGDTGAVKKITWKFKTPILPGEEKAVSFKVRVQ